MLQTQPRKALFSMDCFDNDQPNIEGITYGSHWNGWACPYFTYENGLLIAKLLNDDEQWCIDRDLPVSKLIYLGTKDAFMYIDGCYPDEGEEITPSIIDGVKYYPIGAFGWCWSEVTTEGEQV